MQYESIIKATHIRQEQYHQFDLSADSLRQLSTLLYASVNAQHPLRVRIGEIFINFSFGSNVGLALLTEDEEIHFTTNPASLRELAERLAEMASRVPAENEGSVHIHLEPVFMNGVLNIEDIVFERIEADTNVTP